LLFGVITAQFGLEQVKAKAFIKKEGIFSQKQVILFKKLQINAKTALRNMSAKSRFSNLHYIL
jgi:hypothetical protein